MKLRFLAREDLLVRELGVHRYYGRTFDAATRGWPATKEGAEFESGTPDAEKCAKSCRKGELFAADEATAQAVGVGFVAHDFKDGVYTARLARPATKPVIGDVSTPAKDAS